MKTAGKHGFTLIELMIATTLTTLIVGGAMASLSVILQAYKARSMETNFADTAHLIFNRMQKDIASTFISIHRDMTRFVGQDLESGGLPADMLTFISTVNNTVTSGQGTSDMTEVQYYIDQDDSTPERWLLRRYDPSPDNDPFSGGQTALLGPYVFSINFQYYDGEIWWTSWDSVQEIPIAVYVTIGFFKPRQLGDMPSPETVEEFTTIIPVASYRVPPEDSLGPMGGTAALEAEEEAQG